jgi:hypothetical protein
MQYIIKVFASAMLIVAIAELSKRSSLLGALLASLPLISVLAMVWLYVDTGDVARIATLSTQIFWLVLPSLVLFIALPILLKNGLAFYASLAISIGITSVSYLLLILVLKRFGIRI